MICISRVTWLSFARLERYRPSEPNKPAVRPSAQEAAAMSSVSSSLHATAAPAILTHGKTSKHAGKQTADLPEEKKDDEQHSHWDVGWRFGLQNRCKWRLQTTYSEREWVSLLKHKRITKEFNHWCFLTCCVVLLTDADATVGTSSKFDTAERANIRFCYEKYTRENYVNTLPPSLSLRKSNMRKPCMHYTNTLVRQHRNIMTDSREMQNHSLPLQRKLSRKDSKQCSLRKAWTIQDMGLWRWILKTGYWSVKPTWASRTSKPPSGRYRYLRRPHYRNPRCQPHRNARIS